jgi:hypothetical protein
MLFEESNEWIGLQRQKEEKNLIYGRSEPMKNRSFHSSNTTTDKETKRT